MNDRANGQGRDAALRAFRSQAGPAWRWQLAQRPPSAVLRGGDAYLHTAYAFQHSAGRDPASAGREHALVAAAAALHRNADQGHMLKILVLGGCDRQEIARCLGIDEQTVVWWEALFFDVRPTLDAWAGFSRTSSGRSRPRAMAPSRPR
jgi:hypothetical protein